MPFQKNIETEAKFVISKAATFIALQQITQMGDFEFRPIGTQMVADCYLDTADKHVYRAGYACRTRELDQRQIFTLKSLTPAEGNVHRRQEYELEIESNEPETWPDSSLKNLLLQIIGHNSLEPLFKIHQIRHRYQTLLHNHPVIEFSLDEVSLNDANSIDYYGLEAELLPTGTEADLTKFVATLQANWLLRPETLSKFELGLANTNQQKAEQAAGTLTELERSILKEIAANPQKHLARRAAIILMADAQALPAGIAEKLQLTVRTVRHWLNQFQKKGLAIFPEETFDHVFVQEPLEPAYVQAAALETDGDSETDDIPSDPDGPQAKTPKPGKSTVIKLPMRKRIDLTPTDNLATAGRKVFGFHLARMLHFESGARLGEDIEALHDMRVATRRMRAAFNVFGPAFNKKKTRSLRQGLRTTARVLGAVRDLDVFMEKLQNFQHSLPEAEQEGLSPLLQTWQQQRETARRQLLQYLDSKDYLRFKQDMLNFVKTVDLSVKSAPTETPIATQLRHIVPRLIYTRYETISAYDTVLANASLETLHNLRLAFKAYRYTLEFFRELLGPEVKPVINEVKKIQDHLGDLNDADVAGEMLRDQLARWEEHQLHVPLAERQSPAQLIGYLTAKMEERHHLVVTFPHTWEQFNSLEFKKNQALAVAAL
jgi:CHAD domain-containing protein